MPKPPRNLGAAVRARLLDVAKQRNQQFQLLLTRFALERLLYRLSLTRHRDRFVLKGAMLVTTWLDNPHRPTRDIDFLGFGDPSPEAMLNTFREICAVMVEDGIEFDVAALRVDQIREELEYGGLRIRTIATVGGARANVVIDVGFGDATEPGIEETKLPVLLDLPAPCLKALCARNRHRGKVPGHGDARTREQPNEGLLRYLGPQPDPRVRRRSSCASNRSDFRSPAN